MGVSVMVFNATFMRIESGIKHHKPKPKPSIVIFCPWNNDLQPIDSTSYLYSTYRYHDFVLSMLIMLLSCK